MIKLLKATVLLTTFLIGYVVGAHWIGPSLAPHPVSDTASSSVSSPNSAPAAHSAAPAALSQDQQTPEAVITQTRHHRTGDMGAPGDTGAPAHHFRHRSRVLHPQSSAGDNSAMAPDGGADKVPPGVDPSADSSAGDNSTAATPSDSSGATTPAGDNSDSSSSPAGDSSSASAGPTSSPDNPAPTHRRRRRRKHQAPAPPADNSAGDNSAPPDNSPAPPAPGAGDNSSDSNGRHATFFRNSRPLEA